MTAKIITEGNTQMIVLPEGVRLFNCDEAELKIFGSEFRLIPKVKYDVDEEFTKLSDELIKKNHDAYTQMADIKH